MALIKCPECGKDISDKSPACIHCGYPLSLLPIAKQKEETKHIKTRATTNTKEYSVKIINCNGSKVKVITTLKNLFQYSLDDAKNAVLNLPLTVTTNADIVVIKNIAQEFTDAGIEFEIFEGEKQLTFRIEPKDKVANHYTFTTPNAAQSAFKICPSCGKKTNQPDVFYCPQCNVRYERITEAAENKNVPKCPTCQSVNIKKISGLSKIGNVVLWGVFAVGKVSKQWHCNNCGSEW